MRAWLLILLAATAALSIAILLGRSPHCSVSGRDLNTDGPRGTDETGSAPVGDRLDPRPAEYGSGRSSKVPPSGGATTGPALDGRRDQNAVEEGPLARLRPEEPTVFGASRIGVRFLAALQSTTAQGGPPRRVETRKELR